MPSPPGSTELLVDLARALARLGVAWYVFGAQAALVWGRPRLTTDVDVTVRLGSLDGGEFVRELQAREFDVRIVATPEFVRQTRVLPLVHRPSGLAVDVVLAGPGLEDEFLARAVTVTIGGEPIPFISPEDLVVTKILAGRPKDLEDVRGVLSERGDPIEVDRVRRTLEMLEEALGQSDLLPLFDGEVARARRRQ